MGLCTISMILFNFIPFINISVYQEPVILSEAETPLLSNSWITNGIAISTAVDDQRDFHICNDGFGGAIITWQDYRNMAITATDVYAQRIDINGTLQWEIDGTVICNATHLQRYPELCSDGSGGAIIVYEDARNNGDLDIYSQKINLTGDVQWNINGILVCDRPLGKPQTFPKVCHIGSGDVIVTWRDDNSGYDIYAQKINSSGVVDWTFSGIPICNEIGFQAAQVICSDQEGGAIIAWHDGRDFGSTSTDIFAQKVNSNGIAQWTLNGTDICTESELQENPQICTDGYGGAIITWRDNRTGLGYDIYAQRINSSGIIQWGLNGISICSASYEQRDPQICIDGAGGAIITWEDMRNSDTTARDIYAQRIDSDGNIKWTNNGTVACNADYRQFYPKICADGNGGAIITWQDERNTLSTGIDIYAQKLDSNGNRLWTTNDKIICTAVSGQLTPEICCVETGKAMIVWKDYRSDVEGDIYAQNTDFVPTNGGNSDTPNIPSFSLIFIVSITLIGIYVLVKKNVIKDIKYYR